VLTPTGPAGRPRGAARTHRWPRATTEVVGIIGHPVRHSLSPVLHNAAFDALGLDWAYLAFPVPEGRGAAAVAAMADFGLRGLSVTMPHKADAAGVCHELSAVARRLGSVNTVSLVGERLVGESTDGAGLVAALAEDGWSVANRRCIILGTGGAARSVAVALAEAQVGAIGVVGRRPEAVAELVALAGDVASAAEVSAIADADLVINATPVGMTSGGLPFDLNAEWLHAGQMVADLIYVPATTPLLAAARQAGAATANGLGMLIHQAARQFFIWTGQEAPLDVMSAAALAEIRHRARNS
jgi:shikimate dehydrogenase